MNGSTKIIQPPPFQAKVTDTIVRQENFKPTHIYDYQKRSIERFPVKSKLAVMAHMNMIGSSNTNPKYKIIHPALDFSTTKPQMKA